MNLRSCPRETELSEALKAGHWPDACDFTLREHVNHCERCGELVLLTQTFKAARAEAMVQGELPHPGLLWWRAQLQRRNEALERLSQPTYFVGRFAFLCALLVTLGFAIWQRHNVAGWFDWLGSMPHSGSFNLSSLFAAVSNWSLMLLVGCLGSLVLFGAVALYFSSDKN
jgi:hypothetical protein